MSTDLNDPNFSSGDAMALVAKKIFLNAAMKAKQTNTPLVLAFDGIIQKFYGEAIDELIKTQFKD